MLSIKDKLIAGGLTCVMPCGVKLFAFRHSCVCIACSHAVLGACALRPSEYTTLLRLCVL